MSRIAATFERLRAQGRKALIPYVTAGFPFADVTPELALASIESITVLGALHAPAAVKAALAARLR